MTDLSELKLLVTREHDCGYLPKLQAKTIFVDPEFPMNARLYSELSDFGFRRSGGHIYRPHCSNCQACIPIRIPVELFTPSRSQKRCLKRNKDIQVTTVESIDTDEHYDLYETYINTRHAEGEMFPPSRKQYLDFLTKEWGVTEFLEFRLHDRLIGVSVTDRLDGGISAIYTYFDPNEHKRSLGVFNILSLIERAKTHTHPFLYLGYWIKNCQKMRYKVDYTPFQVYIDHQWITVCDYDSAANPHR